LNRSGTMHGMRMPCKNSGHPQLDLLGLEAPLGALPRPVIDPARVESIAAAAPVVKPNSRDRITIELQGLRAHAHALAAARGVTTAALARKASVALLEAERDDGLGEQDAPRHGTVAAAATHVKVTLRLPAAHVVLLSKRARAADVAQGSYVVGLIDGTPYVPRPANYAEALGALVRSTDQLATTGADLNAFMRVLGHVSAPELEPYRASLRSLTDDVRKHLAATASLVAELKLTERLR
jgi:hypothetical protein